MALAKFNWRAEGGSSTAPQHFSFAFGETWKLTDHTLSKGENSKGCTLDVVLEHDSKVSQLQLVCSASSLQVSVAQKMNSQDFKWLTQMRGTPVPNQPDMFYFRTPEELLTQKLWRLRVKFLFASAADRLRLQSLSLSFDKLTAQRASSGAASFPKGPSYGGVPLMMGAPSGSGKPHLYRGGSASTVTSTTASLSTTPTGMCTPSGSDASLCEDISELSLHGGSDAEEDAPPPPRRRAGSSDAAGARPASRPATATATAATAAAAAPIASRVPSSSASVGSTTSSLGSRASSSSSSSQYHRRRTTGSGSGSPPPPSSSSSSSDRAAVRQLLAVIDQVLAGKAHAALTGELTALRARLVEHLGGERPLSDEELTRTVARIGSVVQSLAGR